MAGTERIQELAEMIGGQRITDTTRAQAKELLDAATAEFAKVTQPVSTRAKSAVNAKSSKPAKTARR